MAGLRRVLAALTPLVAIAAFTLVPTGPAQAATELDESAFVLQRNADLTAWQPLVDATDRVSVPTVLDSANRTATRIENGIPLAPNFAAGFTWEAGDNNTTEWYPQGITTSSDAYDNGLYEGRKLVLVSWYDNQTAPEKGIRVSFVDRTDPALPVYRHVLLAEPVNTGGLASFKAINEHAGGMFLYGNLLYVASTAMGFRVFDLNYLFTATGGDDTKIGRDATGKYNAYGYRYVLPQKFSYAQTVAGQTRFSFVSLDRTTTPDSIVAGEYDVDGPGTKLVRWGIDYTDRELIATGNQATASWAYQVDIRSMQGAASVDGKFFICRSNSSSVRSDLLTWVPGAPATIFTGALPTGGEDLAYRKGTDELWTVLEHPGKRYVLSVTAGKF
jgi:hypothetical protein